MTRFAKKMMEALAGLPLVETRKIMDDDEDNNQGVLLLQTGAPRLK